MGSVTDEQVQQLAATAQPYTLVVLSWGPERHREDAETIEREHQRRMVSLRADGVIASCARSPRTPSAAWRS
jgi:hypothetical protein